MQLVLLLAQLKLARGQPDTLITLNNNKYVFVEATTEKKRTSQRNFLLI